MKKEIECKFDEIAHDLAVKSTAMVVMGVLTKSDPDKLNEIVEALIKSTLENYIESGNLVIKD